MDGEQGERERANVATCDFAVLLRPEAIESAGECCLEVDGVRDSFWGGLAVSGEVDRPVARKEVQSEKGCGKTLDRRVAYWSGSTTLYLI